MAGYLLAELEDSWHAFWSMKFFSALHSNKMSVFGTEKTTMDEALETGGKIQEETG